MKRLMTFAAALSVTALSGCVNSMGQATETEKAQCEVWGRSLPTRSHSDTERTKAEIQEGYADFLNACPAHSYLVP